MISINRRKLFLDIFLFMAIFAPPILPGINLLYLVSAFAIFQLVFRGRSFLKTILKNRAVVIFNAGILVTIIYFCFPMSISIVQGTLIESSNYLMVIYRFFSTIILIEPICLYVLLYCQRYGLEFEDFLKCLFSSTLIEFVFCILTIVSPDIKQILTSIMINNTGYYSNIQSWTIRTRFWGFAVSMTDYFGYSLGLIAGVCLRYALKEKLSYIAFLIPMFIMIYLNALTGLVIFAVAILVYFVFGLCEHRIRIKSIIAILVAFIAVPFILGFMVEMFPSAAVKLIDNIYELIDPSKVQSSNTSIRVLFSSRFWNLPDSWIKILFGAGHSLLSTEFFQRSDVGYINDIWSFGVIGMLIYMFSYFQFAVETYKRTNYKSVIIFSLVSLLVFNIKGVSVGCNAGNMVMLLIIFMLRFLPEQQYKFASVCDGCECVLIEEGENE